LQEADRQARALINQMTRVMSMASAGMGQTIIPNEILWVIVILLFLGFSSCTVLLVQMRNNRFKKRDKKEKKHKKH
jgi:hypothetical protein